MWAVRVEPSYRGSAFDAFWASSGSAGGEHVTVVFPGILTRGTDMSAVFDAVSCDRKSRLLVINYTGEKFDPESISAEFAVVMDQLAFTWSKVSIFAVSIGGLVAALTVSKLSQEAREAISDVYIVDSPFGGDTMKELPIVARPAFTSGMMTKVGKVIRYFNLGKPPKDENIEIPFASSDRPDKYRKEVKEAAMSNLSGHLWSMWASQVGWMAKTDPADFVHALGGLNTVYFSCESEKNDTVRQPMAADRWAASVAGLRVVKVDTAHAAFLEAATTWSSVFKKHISSPGCK